MKEIPSQTGPENIRYDFQDGCRVLLPPGDWHLEIRDLLTQSTLFSSDSQGGLIGSTKKYYLPFSVRVTRRGETVFEHELDLRDKLVLIDMHLGGIGDHLAWMGHVQAFGARHRCQLRCLVRPDMAPLLKELNPAIMVTDDLTALDEDYYARYKVLIFFNDHNRDHQPTDYRQIGLNLSGASILGLPPEERRPSIQIAKGGSPLAEPYVCIATQATGHNKYWNNPLGWMDVISFIKAQGFRVVCIDRDPVNGRGTIWHHIPYGAEDMTGTIPLPERARWLAHAAFFVGLSSGLSWLAWAAGTPVIMISGFTEPYNEFTTDYRIINRNVCNGCSNDVTLPFERRNYMWCPRHTNTERDFECTKMISAGQVKQTITRLMADLEGAARS